MAAPDLTTPEDLLIHMGKSGQSLCRGNIFDRETGERTVEYWLQPDGTAVPAGAAAALTARFADHLSPDGALPLLGDLAQSWRPRPHAVERKRGKPKTLWPRLGPDNGLPTVTVTRPGRWGNPHRVTDDLPRAEAVARFRADLMAGGLPYTVQMLRQPYRGTEPGCYGLRGANLACFCDLPATGQPDVCHRAVLLGIANS